MPDLDEYIESDASDNEDQYSKLLSSVSQLDSTQRVKPASRKEINSQVSEYTLVKGASNNNNLVNVKELAQILGSKSQHGSVGKKVIRVTDKSKTLAKPLEKPTEERLKRSLGFVKVKNQLKRWDAIVARNALKDQIKFPIANTYMKLQRSNEFLSQFKNTTPLEIEISNILNQNIRNEKEEPDDKTFPLTLEEMMEKRKEMAQLRAKLSYKEAKAQRQSKIKSKKYHRILKREKLRQQLKEFELLQKSDPEGALKKLKELDMSRAQERASLRHRNTGHWAKNMSVRAKYDIESRKVLADQLKMSREITQKVKNVESSDDEDTNEYVTPEINKPESVDKENPWSIKVSKEMENFVSGYKKYWSEQGKEISKNEETPKEKEQNQDVNKLDQNGIMQKNIEEEKCDTSLKDSLKEKLQHGSNKLVSANGSSKPQIKKRKTKNKTSVIIQPSSGVWIVSPVHEEEGVEPECKNKEKVNDIDTMFDELNDRLIKTAEKRVKKIKSKLKAEEKKEKKLKKIRGKEEEDFDLKLKRRNELERPDMDVGLIEGDEDGKVEESSPRALPLPDTSVNHSVEVDPKNFIQVKPKKLYTSLPDNATNGDEGIDDEEVQQMTIEEAFGNDDVGAEFNEMKKQEENDSNIQITTTLPGWGAWGGADIKPNPRKKRRLILNLPPRKDKKKSDTIINENENPKLKDHLVKEVPHPFKSVEAFEANIRAPVGRDWMPETAHRVIIQKQVETTMGAVIEPMDEEEIVRDKKKTVSPYQGKKRNQKSKKK